MQSLDIDVTTDRVRSAVEYARIDRIRKVEAEEGLDGDRFGPGYVAVGSSRGRDWRVVFGSTERETYARLAEEYGIADYPPEP